MQVRRRGGRIAGVADIADDLAGIAPSRMA
jgi:hypothetical protein